MSATLIHEQQFEKLTESNKEAVNEFIDFLYHKENQSQTLEAINDALSGNTIGPFNSVSELMEDLYAED